MAKLGIGPGDLVELVVEEGSLWVNPVPNPLKPAIQAPKFAEVTP